MVVACWLVIPDHVARAQFMELCARIASRTEPCARLVIQDMTTAPVMVKAKKPRTSVVVRQLSPAAAFAAGIAPFAVMDLLKAVIATSVVSAGRIALHARK